MRQYHAREQYSAVYDVAVKLRSRRTATHPDEARCNPVADEFAGAAAGRADDD